MPYVPDANNTSEPTSARPAGTAAAEFRAIKQKIASIIAGSVVVTAAGANSADITSYIMPESRTNTVEAGWMPWNLNQQWGGAPMPFHLVDSATGTEYKFDAFDAYVDLDGGANMDIGQAAARVNQYQSINPAKNLSLQAVWVRAYKTGNPVDNLTLQLWSVAAGLPNALIATANVINGKQITSDNGSQWYRFAFAAPQALVGGTQYMFVVTRSGAVDPANFYQLLGKLVTRFPNNFQGFGTAVPAWTAANTLTKTFVCEAQASDQVLQTGGTFTNRIVGSEGTPLNRSVGFCKPLRDFMPIFHPNGWSILIRGKTWTKDRTIFDAVYGLHHDRINVRCNAATGFTAVNIYQKDGTVNTITGTGDVSGNTYKDILIVGRTVGDGGDYCKIYTGLAGVWTKEAEVIAQTYIFDTLMSKQGTGWIMGGFPLFNNAQYTKLSDMNILPSADGWTFTTTSATVEGNVFAVSGGKLNQIKAGMAAGGDGYYLKNAAGFSNANGWLVTRKSKTISSSNSAGASPDRIELQDGTKRFVFDIQEFFTDNNVSAGASYGHIDSKSNDCTYISSGKGSDTFTFINGKLVHDDTGRLTTAVGGNFIQFGDQITAANENADVIYDYVGYYNTANLFPQFTSGELHEFTVFSGDKNTLAQATYNAGVPISIKSYCGVPRNYIGEQQEVVTRQLPVTNGSTTASVTATLLADMECFVLGADVSIYTQGRFSNDTGGSWTGTFMYMDGVFVNPLGSSTAEELGFSAAGNYEVPQVYAHKNTPTFYGLHKIEWRWRVSGNTGSNIERSRHMHVTTKATTK